MTTLESKIFIDNEPFSVADCLRNMRCSFDKNEALRWGFFIQKAFLELGYNPDIDKTMNQILASKNVPNIVAKADERPDGDLGMPPALINKIFKTGFNQEQLKSLWRWIKEYAIDNISFPYQYLSLLLFLEHNHSSFLQKPHISNADMQDQMMAWYSTEKVKCSADSLGTYREPFFNSNQFEYVKWVNSNGEPPLGYEYKKDQSLLGFQALVRLCSDLDLNMSELKMK